MAAKLRLGVKAKRMRLINAIWTFGLFGIVMVLLPALTIYWMEQLGYSNGNKDFADALYFVFMSVTSIGLGDYVPSFYKYPVFDAVFKVFVSIFLVLSVSTFAFVAKTLGELFSDVQLFDVDVRDRDEDSETTRPTRAQNVFAMKVIMPHVHDE